MKGRGNQPGISSKLVANGYCSLENASHMCGGSSGIRATNKLWAEARDAESGLSPAQGVDL